MSTTATTNKDIENILRDGPPNPDNRLLDATGLLNNIFAPEARPTDRWLRERVARREIPFVRLGRLCFFDPVAVRGWLAEKQTTTRRAN